MNALMPLPDIILASASQARTRLLSDAGVEHRCDPADIDEHDIKCRWMGTPQGLAQKLALEKARVVSLRHEDALVIGSDQVLALGDEIFDKPVTIERTRAQLKHLRGREHRLISAVCVVRNGDQLWSDCDQAVLKVREFSDAFLQNYLHHIGDDVMFCVGGYHLEGLGAQLFESVEGDFFTVLGLPLIALLGFLRTQGALEQ